MRVLDMSTKAIFLAIASSALLVGCDALDTMTDGLAHSEKVSEKLESELGLKSLVGFNWNNGSLTSVTVTFEGLPSSPGLPDISDRVRSAVLEEFKQTPRTIVVAFSIQQ